MRHRFAVFVAVSTFLLIVAGGLVTSTGSGLAVPDWPLSFGQVFPRMEGGVLFEHGHRMVASAVGLLTIILAVWTSRAEPRAWVRSLGWAMLATVIIQGILGGITVLAKLPDAVSISHAGLAQIFFSLTVIMAAVTAPDFAAAGAAVRRMPGLAMAVVSAIYGQILLGAVVRHTGAGLVIPDFPLAFGGLIPPFSSPLIAWHFAHRVGALVVAIMVVMVLLRVFRDHRGVPQLTRPALALALTTALQIVLGAFTIWSTRAVVPTTAHVATGALVLVAAVLLAVRWTRFAAGAVRAPASALLDAEPVAS